MISVPRVRILLRHPRWALIVALLVTGLAIYLSQKISLRSNFSDLLPEDNDAVLQARALDEEVGGASFVVVAVETKDAEAAKKFLGDLKSQVSKRDDVLYVDDQSPEGFFQDHGFLYLSLEDLEDVKNKVQRKIEQAKLKATGFYIELDEEENSFDLNQFRGRYSPYFNPYSYYQNSSGTLFVSLIKPAWRTTDVAHSEQFIDALKQILSQLKPESYHDSISVRLTGPYVKAMAQQKILRHDAMLVSLIALLGSVAYLIFHFRRKRAVFLIAVPLIASVSWTLALAYLFYGSLNLFSSVACAIIVGLAADYGIHLYSEYLHIRERGESTEEAFFIAIQHLKRPFFIAATSTSAAFFSLGLSHFKAFSEFGMIAGPGILLCALAFVLIMPPLAVWIESWSPEKIERRPVRKFSLIASGKVGSWILSGRAAVIVGLVLLLPLITVATGRLYFDYNMDHIMGQQPTKALDNRVDAIFSNTVNPEVALVENPEDAPRLAKALRDVRDRHEGQSTIKSVVALSDFVPTAQDEKIVKVAEIRKLLTPDVVKALRAEDQAHYTEFEAMLDPVPLKAESLPQQILHKFRDQTGAVGRILFIFPNFSVSESDTFMRYVEEIRTVECADCEGPYYISGESSVFYEIINLLFSEGKFVMGAALLAVFILLWINFRSFKETWVAMAPLLFALTSLVGWMALLGLPLNIINLAAFPIVLGVVTDYVVHLYQRYRNEKPPAIKSAYTQCFGAILGSTLTTLIGFASLLFADMGGLRSLGALASLGILLGSVTTLFWFPGLLAVLSRRAVQE